MSDGKTRAIAESSWHAALTVVDPCLRGPVSSQRKTLETLDFFLKKAKTNKQKIDVELSFLEQDGRNPARHFIVLRWKLNTLERFVRSFMAKQVPEHPQTFPFLPSTHPIYTGIFSPFLSRVLTTFSTIYFEFTIYLTS